jgi:hypothetical protein
VSLGGFGVVDARPSPVRLYLLAVGALLLAQGAISLLVRASGSDPHETTRLLSDPRHALIHVVWGAVLLPFGMRVRDPRALAVMALVFGDFYLALLVLGLAVHHPLGLMIDGGENAFHAIISALGLLVGVYGLARLRPRAPSSEVPPAT